MYNFKEKELGPKFAQDKLKEFRELIEAAISFTVLSMPGVGVSYFLKYLVCQDFARSARGARRAHFVHIDIYSLPSLTQKEFYKLTLKELGGKVEEKSEGELFKDIQNQLEKLAKSNEKIVLVFSRFDQLKSEFTGSFLSYIQSLTTIAPGKIVLIFTATKPIYEINPEAVLGGNLPFYSKILYFAPYSKEDIRKLFSLDHTVKAHPNLDSLIEASGGHYQLFHIFLNSHKQQNLLLDKFVLLQLKDLVNYLDYQQRKQVQKIAFGSPRYASGAGKTPPEVDEYLLGVGMVKKKLEGFELFTPILSQYIKTHLTQRLPPKEAKLLNLLRKNMEKVVSKDEIFETLWENSPEKATDWALDALIYRLRNHPFMKAHGYIIESQKKIGYSLIQI